MTNGKMQENGCGCGGSGKSVGPDTGFLKLAPLPVATPSASEPCCGGKSGPAASPFARPGYLLLPFVETFIESGAGPAPVVKTVLECPDFLGTLRTRLGIRRDHYQVAPGLYAVGRPGSESPVLVTANYKLSFDSLRQALAGIDAWLLILDSRGINVWCAAGKKTFSTDEVILQVQKTGLERVVTHRRLILPQLGASGVSARKVRQGCGFEVVWGPIRAADVPAFLQAGLKAEPGMRQMTFTMAERLVLIPVELSLLLRPALGVLLVILILSGLNPQIFSIYQAWSRGVWGYAALGTGILAGAVLTPLLLPWLPGRPFFLKGILVGMASATGLVILAEGRLSGSEILALELFAVAVSSFAAMNFTGATPFTSPSGVEKEMRWAIPLQAVMVLAAAVLWTVAGF